jgi:beta-barrel assembly-enhancing protease
MTRARISSDGLADFFTRIAAMTDGVPEFLSSHPLSADRAARAHANAEAERTSGLDLSPALSASDWAALKGICG